MARGKRNRLRLILKIGMVVCLVAILAIGVDVLVHWHTWTIPRVERMEAEAKRLVEVGMHIQVVDKELRSLGFSDPKVDFELGKTVYLWETHIWGGSVGFQNQGVAVYIREQSGTVVSVSVYREYAAL